MSWISYKDCKPKTDIQAWAVNELYPYAIHEALYCLSDDIWTVYIRSIDKTIVMEVTHYVEVPHIVTRFDRYYQEMRLSESKIKSKKRNKNKMVKFVRYKKLSVER